MTDARPIFVASVTNTVLLLAKGYTRLASVNVLNANAAIVYLQLFDAAAAADVTIGTTVPDKTIKIEASVAPIISFNIPPRFNKGLCYAITTTDTGAIAVGSACDVNFDIA
jgi:hypothetical protein